MKRVKAQAQEEKERKGMAGRQEAEKKSAQTGGTALSVDFLEELAESV